MSEKHPFINQIIVAISLASFSWVIYKLWTFNQWESFILLVKENRSHVPLLLAFQLLLLILNLSIETRKWQLLIQPVSKISFFNALHQVIKGIQMGLITPARAGDFIGKSIFFSSGDRAKVVILSLSGSIIQSIVIGATTIWAILWTGKNGTEYIHLFLNQYNNLPLWTILLVLILTGTTILMLKKYIFTKAVVNRLSTHFRILTRIGFPLIVKAFTLTALRYLVFCTQFLLFLQFFGLTDTRAGLATIFLFYGAITFLPSAGAGDLGMRATVALMIFGQTAVSGPGIVIASMMLWFVNLALPALLLFFAKPVSGYIKPIPEESAIPT
jgi:hypothetical protein